MLTLLVTAITAVAEQLPEIGPAPAFELTAQDGGRLSLDDMKGKVVAVSFIYTACPDVCPLLSYKLRGIQDELERAGHTDVVLVSITMDPEHDTPDHLKSYVNWLGADPKRWAFLTGAKDDIRKVARHYGIYFKQHSNGVIGSSAPSNLVWMERTGKPANRLTREGPAPVAF